MRKFLSRVRDTIMPHREDKPSSTVVVRTAASRSVRPVFSNLTLPGGRTITVMREDAFQKALAASARAMREWREQNPDFMTNLEDRMPRRGDWIQTYSGKQFWPLDPRPEDVDIVDIAHALSLLCRFNGHCTRFYSVAEHCIHVSHFVPPEYALWGLLHDAAEAYTSDIPRPLKRSLPDWKPMEDRIMEAVCRKFGMATKEPAHVKYIDLAITSDEKDALMNPSVAPWGALPPPLGADILGLEPPLAEGLFLARFKELTS